MADTLSFEEAERFIRANPKIADALAIEYLEFLKTHPEGLPPDAPKNVLDGKAISEAYFFLREQHEESQMQQFGQVDRSQVPVELAALPLLAASFFQKPKIMQDDEDYQKIEKNLKNEWLKKNPGKDFSSKEGLDYLHGSLEDPAKNHLAKDAESSFRNNPKFKKRIERYDREAKRIYKNPQDDPQWILHEHNVNLHIQDRLQLLQKTLDENLSKEDVKIAQEGIIKATHEKSSEEFVAKFPNKARAYSEKNADLKTAYEKHEQNQTREMLSSYTEASGKDIRPVFEKTHRDRSISLDEATKRLEGITSSAQTQGETHHPHLSKQPSGGINRGINALNRLAERGIPNPVSQIGSKLAQRTVIRGIVAFLASPAGLWALAIMGAILSVFIITLVIVGLATPPSTETLPQPASTPIPISITPPAGL